MSGFIYILSNESMPGLLKIGYTERHPKERLRELQSTGVPTPFKLEFAVWSKSATWIERLAHREVKGRQNQNREFFKVNIKDAAEVISELCLKHLDSKDQHHSAPNNTPVDDPISPQEAKEYFRKMQEILSDS